MEDFLKNAPLYQQRVLRDDGHEVTTDLFARLPAITAECPECKGKHTFNVELIDDKIPAEYEHHHHILTSPSYHHHIECIKSGGVHCIKYQCKKCNSFVKTFFLLFEEKKAANTEVDEYLIVYVQKIGQYPPYSIDPESVMRSYLDDKDLALYKHGLVSESHGYGIGAFAYYRQIVENKIDDLMGDIESLAGSVDEEMKASFQEARSKTSVAEKINLIYEYLPSKLKPGGENVLKIIYTELSNGLHNKSDDECLRYAQSIKNCLVFLIRRMEEQKAADESFHDSIKNIK